ncbi:MAG: hypothetical protein ACKPKO_38495, partial [Candidatus Fonsibacter sp.]
MPVSPRAPPPPPPVLALHSVASSPRPAPPPPPPDLLVKRIGSGPVMPPPPPCPPPATQRPRLTVLTGMPEQPTLATTTRGVACSTAALAV